LYVGRYRYAYEFQFFQREAFILSTIDYNIIRNSKMGFEGWVACLYSTDDKGQNYSISRYCKKLRGGTILTGKDKTIRIGRYGGERRRSTIPEVQDKTISVCR
jgi:hypothetical protein